MEDFFLSFGKVFIQIILGTIILGIGKFIFNKKQKSSLQMAGSIVGVIIALGALIFMLGSN